MLLAASTSAWCSLLCARAALNKLRGLSAQHCSTATRQGSGRCRRGNGSSWSSLHSHTAALWQSANRPGQQQQRKQTRTTLSSSLTEPIQYHVLIKKQATIERKAWAGAMGLAHHKLVINQQQQQANKQMHAAPYRLLEFLESPQSSSSRAQSGCSRVYMSPAAVRFAVQLVCFVARMPVIGPQAMIRWPSERA